MKKFKLLSLLLIIAMVTAIFPVPAFALSDPVLTAQSVMLMNADTGEIFYQKNADASVQPGALTTLMTALMAAEAIERQEMLSTDLVTASETFGNDLNENSTVVDPAIAPGEMMTVGDLLHFVLLRSAADAANILAEQTSGSLNSFIDTMNRRATELGCTGTHFVNATGAASDSQRTTARDMALIAQAAFSSSTLLTVMQKAEFTSLPTETAVPRTVTNPNQLVVPNSENYYPYAYAGKTATVTDLGGCLVAAASHNDINLIAVVLGCAESADRFAETASLFEWVFSNYDYRLILSSTEALTTVPVELGNPGSVGVRAETSMSLLLPNDREMGNVQYEIVYDHDQNGIPLQAPINAGQSLGTVTVYMDGVAYGSSRLVASSSVEISRMDYLRTQLDVMIHAQAVRQIVTILIILLAVYLLLVAFYLIQRMRHLRSLRIARRDRAIARAQQEAEYLSIPDDNAPSGYFQQPDPAYDYDDEEYDDDDDAPGGRHARRDAKDDYFDKFYN